LYDEVARFYTLNDQQRSERYINLGIEVGKNERGKEKTITLVFI